MVNLIRIKMHVDIVHRNSLKMTFSSISKQSKCVLKRIVLADLSMRKLWEHVRVVIIQLWKLILQSHKLEDLSANVAPVERTFSDEVIHLLMSMRILLWSRTLADDDSPWGVTCENEYRVVNCSELSMHCWLHVVPSVHIDWVLCEISIEVHGSVSVCSWGFGKLRLIIVAIGLEKGIDVSIGKSDCIFYFIHQSKVVSVEINLSFMRVDLH